MKKKLSFFFFTFLFQSAFSQQTVGLFTQNAGSLDGYVLFSPVRSDTTFLIDKCGKLIHHWVCSATPGLSAYLLPDGSLLRSGNVTNSVFMGNGSIGGLIERYDWNGNLLWSYTISDSLEMQNHDICAMPNGNVMVAVWEKLYITQAISAGRNPALLGTEIWSAKLVELQPVGTNQASIVWQWRLWDHLVQHYDSTKSNYGIVADHAELLNLNFIAGNPTNPDWIHLNAVTYNPTLDQVMMSTHSLSEIWIVDHSTTTTEAASHAGGLYGKGGDFLYRWGNPAAYNRGTAADQKLFRQHDPEWIQAGYKDGNNIMIFNNGVNRPGGNYSSVDIIAPPIDTAGNYSINAGQPFAPVNSYWSYSAFVPASFYSNVMGGASRLSNGNTIICEATKGNLFEIDSTNNMVWRYVNPVGNAGPISQGTTTNKNGVFKCALYEPTYAAFAGQTLTPGNPIELNPLAYNCNMLTAINQINKNSNAAISVINPFSESLEIQSNTEIENATIDMVDITGRLIYNRKSFSLVKGNLTSLKLPNEIPPGIYFLNLKTTKHYFSLKLIHD